MTQEPLKTPAQLLNNNHLEPFHLSQHGSLPRDASGLGRGHSGSNLGSQRPPGPDDQPLPGEDAGVNADQLDEKLRRLSFDEAHDDSPSVPPGQRVSEYEKALTPQAAKQGLGFQVIKRSEPRSDAIRLDNFPNGKLSSVARPAHTE